AGKARLAEVVARDRLRLAGDGVVATHVTFDHQPGAVGEHAVVHAIRAVVVVAADVRTHRLREVTRDAFIGRGTGRVAGDDVEVGDQPVEQPSFPQRADDGANVQRALAVQL